MLLLRYRSVAKVPDSHALSLCCSNERPNLDDVLLEVRENSPVATLIGDALNGTDPDIGQFLLYTMERSRDSGPFKLGACSGQLEVAVAELDFETKDLYTLYVTVTDDGVDPYKLSDTAVITILILDVNEVRATAPCGPFNGAPRAHAMCCCVRCLLSHTTLPAARDRRCCAQRGREHGCWRVVRRGSGWPRRGPESDAHVLLGRTPDRQRGMYCHQPRCNTVVSWR